MKTRNLLIFMCVLLLLSLTGCGGGGENGGSGAGSKYIFEYNEGKETKSYTLQVVEAVLTKDIVPTNEKGWYTHYEANSGEVYLDVIMKIKNTSGSAIDLWNLFDGKAYIDNNEYSGIVFMESESRSDFDSFGSLSPLAEEYVHFAAAVPEKTTTENKITIKLTIDGKIYTIDCSDAINKTMTEIEKRTVTLTDKSVAKIDNVTEFYIEGSSIKKKVVPPKAKGWYSYFEAEENKVYIDVIFSYKNLSTTDVECDTLFGGVKLVYNDTYEYKGFAIVEEDSRSDFTYANITSISPLANEYVHYLFAVPESISKDGGSLLLTFRIGDHLYRYSVR